MAQLGSTNIYGTLSISDTITAEGVIQSTRADLLPIFGSTSTTIGSTTTPIYLNNGVLTAGTALKTLAYKDSLTASDIPNLDASKITSGTLGVDRLSLASTSTNGAMSAADKTKLNSIESGAQVNTITGIKGNSESSYRTGNVNITAANIGLGNVTNNKQIKALSSSVVGDVPLWSSTSGDSLSDSGVKFTVTTSGSDKIVTISM
jgi:hypothetical protein